MIRLRSESATETQAIAAAVAGVLEPGDLVVLVGDLGSGKTTFVQGAVRALGSHAAVTSPTFAIVQEYRDGATGIAHVDAYRLERVQELHDIGFDELLDGTMIVFVEWGDRVRSVLPDDYLHVTLAMRLGDASAADKRFLTVEPRGAAWHARAERLTHALEACTPEDCA